MKLFALILTFTFAANAKAVVCEQGNFKKCARGLLIRSSQLRDDVASYLISNKVKPTKTNIDAFIKTQSQNGLLDIVKFANDDGGDYINMPAGHLGVIQLGAQNQVYEIDMTVTNIENEKNSSQHGKLWRTDKNSSIARVNIAHREVEEPDQIQKDVSDYVAGRIKKNNMDSLIYAINAQGRASLLVSVQISTESQLYLVNSESQIEPVKLIEERTLDRK